MLSQNSVISSTTLESGINVLGTWCRHGWTLALAMCFLIKFLINAMHPETSKKHKLNESSLRELVKWLGVWFLMCYFEGEADSRELFSDKLSQFEDAPLWLNGVITRNLFDDTKHLCIINVESCQSFWINSITKVKFKTFGICRWHKIILQAG